MKRAAGFTLIELLTVISIFGLITLGTLPVIRSMGNSGTLEGGLYDIRGLLEYARNEAVARQAYVWVGFSNAIENGSHELVMAAATASDGSATGTTLRGISRIVRLPNVEVIEWNQLSASLRNRFPGQPGSAMENPNARTLTVGSRTFPHSLTFTPQGSVMRHGSPTPLTPYDLWIDLSLRETRGGTVPPDAREVSLLINGANGVLQTLEP